MPLYIRHLPGSHTKLVDEASLPKNTVTLNPSVAYPIVYIRQIDHFQTKEENSVFLFNLETKQSHKIPSPSSLLIKNVNLFRGIEDLRICWYNDLLWFAGTCTHASDNITSEMVVGHFDKNLTRVERMSHVDIGSFPVKNVCPFVVGDKLLLFDIFLHSVYELIDSTDENGVRSGTNLKNKFTANKVLDLVPGAGVSIEGYRGSTSPVHLHGSTWGAVVHDIIFNDQASLVTRLSYIHHWIEFDVVSGVVSFVSTPFWVAHWGIEYVSGIHLDKNKSNVTLYFGVNDNMTFVYNTSLHDLRHGK